jgi:hypothetical protein
LDGTAHKEWANSDNSILIQPNGEQDCEDGVFFKKNEGFNQGTFLTFDENELVSAMETAETRMGQINSCGSLLSQTFSYKNALEQILSKMHLAQ